MLIDTLTCDMKEAMKAQDKLRLGVLRMLVSELKYRLIDKPDLNSEDEVRFLMGEAKKRRDSIEAYKNVSPERARAEEEELILIESYMPVQMSDDEITNIAKSIKQDNPGLVGGPLVGRVMGEIKKMGEVVDGARVKMVIDKLEG